MAPPRSDNPELARVERGVNASPAALAHPLALAWQARAGEVWLVGAGTGDPGLITLKGWHLLASADVVVHDRLGCEELVAALPDGVRRVDVGKGPGCAPVSQEEIARVLEREARTGNAVVRLKGGDPFVFGRGLEEWQHLHAAGVRCRVVPGISSSIAAPAAAGIPVTHRREARHFLVSTAHTDTGELPRLGHADTQVFLMGVGSLARVVEGLLAVGAKSDTPAALVASATTYRQRVLRSTLGAIARDAAAAGIESPAVLVVGNTVALAEDFTARREVIVVTGQRVPRLLAGRRREAEFLWRPLWRAEPLAAADVYTRRDEFAAAMEADVVLFNSPPAVEGFFGALPALGWDARRLRGRLAVVGEEAAEALAALRLTADIVVAEGTSEGLAAALAPTDARRVVVPCAEQYGGRLVGALVAAGVGEVSALAVYRQVAVGAAAVDWSFVDAVSFASPGAVARFVAAWPAAPVERLKAYVIGEGCGRAALAAGFARVENLAETSAAPAWAEEA